MWLSREFEYIRHGTLSWFLNFDVVTGQVIEPSWGPTRNEEDALAHLQRLIESDPQATKWHLVLDNLNIHQSESLVCLRDPTHQVVFYYTPKHACLYESGGNLVEYSRAQAAQTREFHFAG